MKRYIKPESSIIEFESNIRMLSVSDTEADGSTILSPRRRNLLDDGEEDEWL